MIYEGGSLGRYGESLRELKPFFSFFFLLEIYRPFPVDYMFSCTNGTIPILSDCVVQTCSALNSAEAMVHGKTRIILTWIVLFF